MSMPSLVVWVSPRGGGGELNLILCKYLFYFCEEFVIVAVDFCKKNCFFTLKGFNIKIQILFTSLYLLLSLLARVSSKLKAM